MTQPLYQMLERYWAALVASAPLVIVAVSLALALSFLWARRWERGPGEWSTGPVFARHRLALGLMVLCGVVWGGSLAWIGDDAFISFRYAENLANGHGLVFNPGERVEGYTNFLWTLLLAGFVAIGFDPAQVSLILSLLCFAGLIGLVPRVLRAACPDVRGVGISVAGILVAVQYSLASFATSGLETMFAAFLSLLAIERALYRSPLAAGAFGVAATLAHPDHGILYVALGAALALERGRWREIVRYALPFAVLYVPYFLWRWHYYGEFFPNTYYAKSTDLWYLSQGGLYVASFLIGSGLWLSLPLIAFGVTRIRNQLLGRYLLIALPLFLLYVAKIGGDFMYGRLLCPLLAPLFIAAEVGLRALFAQRRWALGTAALVLLALAAVPTRILESGEKVWHISDERTFYPVVSFSPLEVQSRYFRWARTIDRHLRDRGIEPRIALECVGTVGYYTGLPVIDTLGLTDPLVAHLPIAQRGRPGHEKRAPIAHVFERGVELSDRPLYPKPYADWTRFRLGRFDFYLAHYDPMWLERLEGPEAMRLAALKTRVDAYVTSDKKGQSAEELACDAWFYDHFASPRNDTPRLRAAVQTSLLEAGRVRRRSGDERVLTRDLQSTHHPDPATAIRFNAPWQDAARFTQANAPDPFGNPWIAPGGPGWEGEVLTTRVADAGHVATIRLRSEPFELVGDVLEFWLAGGRHAENLSVSLWVDGARRFTATGCGSELRGRRLWWIAPFTGSQGVLEVEDSEPTRTAYLVVDDIVQWVPHAGAPPAGADRVHP